MKKIGLLLFLITSLLIGCKQAEKIVVVEKKVKRLSVGRVIKLVNESELNYKTLSVNRFNLTFEKDGKSSSIRGLYKIRRDSVIQISAQKLSIPVGKLEANSDSFKVVYHLDKQIFDGSYDYVSELLGTDIDFKTMQAILSSQLYSFRQEENEREFRDFVCGIEEDMYKISSMRDRKLKKIEKNEDRLERIRNKKEDNHLIKQDIYIDPDLFLVRKMVFTDIDFGRTLTIGFSDFEIVQNQWFPGNINLLLTGEQRIELNIDLSKISIDEEESFSFSLPAKYKKIRLD